jgi:hypothetical protein
VMLKLQTACANLPMLAEREQIALVKRDMRVLSETQSAKMLVAEEMETHVLKIKRLGQSLARTHRDISGATEPSNISDTVKLLNSVRSLLAKDVSATGLAVLDHLIQVLSAQHAEFKKFQRTVWPRLEANQTIIAKQLRFHRENFAFWKKVEDEMAAPYGRTGAPAITNPVSILNVKA